MDVHLYAAVKPTCYNINLCYFDLWFYVTINNFIYTKNKNYRKQENINKTPASSLCEYLSKLFARMQFYAVGCGLFYVDDGKNKISKMSLNHFFFHLIKMTCYASNNFND